MDDIFNHRRTSQMNLDEVYFYTTSINGHKHLLKQDKFKNIIISSMSKLVENKVVTIYSFVIMPNHLHIIWKLNSLNGKEKPNASFSKETAHLIVKDLKEYHPLVLDHFKVLSTERSFRIWQRDSMAILMNSKIKVEQKIDYIHVNPLQEHWNLCKYPEEYEWSSASFYILNDKKFEFLTDYREYFG